MDCANARPARARRGERWAQASDRVQSTCVERAFAESTPERPRHYALILDRGPDALLARVNLLRSATTSIDLQTYIFDEDDAGHLVLDELLAAARRGVRVRVLLDQLSALRKASTLAALASQHVNLDVRLYNPVFNDSRLSYPHYLAASLCCWRPGIFKFG